MWGPSVGAYTKDREAQASIAWERSRDKDAFMNIHGQGPGWDWKYSFSNQLF